jgi:hypothetical protein
MERSVQCETKSASSSGIAVLIQLRVFVGKLVFTAAVVYGIYHAFVLLAK